MAITHIATAVRQDMGDACVDKIDAGAGAGTVKFYTATMPANANTAVSGQTLLGTVTCSATAFGDTNTSGVASANDFTPDASADADGTVAWARIADSNGNTVMDVDVTATAGGGTLTVADTSFTAGGEIDITGFTVTMPDGT